MTKKINLTNNTAVIISAPQELYAAPPKDYSKSRLVNCPHCEKPMWLSEKKEAAMDFAIAVGRDILQACFICFDQIARDNIEWFKKEDFTQINL